MFSCRACLLRSLRAVVGDAPSSRRAWNAPFLLDTPTTRTVQRRYESSIGATTNIDDYGPLLPGKQSTLSEEQTDVRASKKTSSTALTSTQKKHLELELKYLRDPFKLAQHVKSLLEHNKVEKALDLVRFASKDMAAVVSWNHIVDWYMRRTKFDDAIKIYNEMKKRAIFPDSHTYIMLLRGLAKSHHLGKAVKESNVVKAVNIYNSMSSPTSRAKPDVRHANAALSVCAAAGDMDAMWGIFSHLDDAGPFSPDHMTYNILIDALRYANTSDIPQGNDLAGITRIRAGNIQGGKKIWRELIPRWRAGEVAIDAQIVCSMARLLLTSPLMEDRDDIFSLVQQTTNIERLLLPLDHPDRHVEHIPGEPGAAIARTELEEEDAEGYKELPATQVFRSVKPFPADPAHPKRPTTLAWVAPTSRMLSILVDACAALRTPKTANAYWELFTKKHGVVPDSFAFNAQLKLLATYRNSARAAKLVREEMSASGIEIKNQTFRIAMRACSRDNKNPNVVSHARDIVDKMDETQADLDIHTLIQYLSLALLSNDATKIVNALNRLDPIQHKLRSRMTYGTEGASMTPEAHAIDTLMNRGLVDRDQYSHWHDRRSNLNQFIGRAVNSLEKQQERLKSKEAHFAARQAMERNAKEAGRLVRQRKYEDRGLTEPRMSKDEWALKVFRRKEKRREGVAERQDRFGRVASWRVKESKNDSAFADSPLDFAVR